MKITLHKPSTKLAALYLAIIMAISLFFSATVYRLSIAEFEKVRGVPGVVMRFPVVHEEGAVAAFKERLLEEQEDLYQEAKGRILSNLVLTNVAILIGAGFLSYYLARRTLQPIEEAQEAQNRFTADASHELRTPIAAMRSETEVALMDPKLTLALAKSRLKSNLEELEKLTALSEGLLRLAQFENGELPKVRVAIEDIVQRALDRAMPLAEAKNILIRSDIPPRGHILGDQTSLTEALVILLDNAVKYSPEKTEVELTVSLGQKQVTISVGDHGMGIKATELPHIFERFYRADSARSKQQTDGYGLGLAIARNIVDVHDGSLVVESTRGKGSLFTIRLPRV
jgi:two-component system, OmpR family, sensor histidine kinase CiaH